MKLEIDYSGSGGLWPGGDSGPIEAEQPFEAVLRRGIRFVNDADVAEVRYGTAVHQDGFVIVTTLETGVGSAFLLGAELIPNTELSPPGSTEHTSRRGC